MEPGRTPAMSKMTRRTFLGGLSSASAASLLPSGTFAKRSPNETPAKFGNIVAFCDVEQAKGGKRGGFSSAAAKWPKARRYTDWRVMLDKEKNLDGVTISTPDHMHAPVTMTALQQGLGHGGHPGLDRRGQGRGGHSDG